jgi:hypothetical protein
VGLMFCSNSDAKVLLLVLAEIAGMDLKGRPHERRLTSACSAVLIVDHSR